MCNSEYNGVLVSGSIYQITEEAIEDYRSLSGMDVSKEEIVAILIPAFPTKKRFTSSDVYEYLGITKRVKMIPQTEKAIKMIHVLFYAVDAFYENQPKIREIFPNKKDFMNAFLDPAIDKIKRDWTQEIDAAYNKMKEKNNHGAYL